MTLTKMFCERCGAKPPIVGLNQRELCEECFGLELAEIREILHLGELKGVKGPPSTGSY